jgi:diguanylate cyclase (GGDEF)-like protein/PAS domain S-box-containing protein
VITDQPSAKLLLVDNDPAVAERIRMALASSGSFDVEWVRQLSVGLDRLGKKGITAVLLALSLPDSEGIETFVKLYTAAPDIPILILSENGREALAVQAVERGAHDYLPPDHLNSYSLLRALRNAINGRAAEDALHVEKDRSLVTLNSIGDAVLCTDISGHITYLNLVAETMTGWSHEEAMGKLLAEVFDIVDGATRRTAQDPLELAVEQDRTVGLTMNCVLIRRDKFEYAIEDSAAPIHDRTGRIIGAVIVFHDVSAARAMALQMTYSAHHDLVTDLPNRLLFNDRLSQSIALAHRQAKPIAVLFLDLDRFKSINDSLGHAVGDKLLQSISKRLVAGLRHSDTVSRQGGDEFVILLSEIAHSEDAGVTAEKLLLSIGAPYSIDGHDLYISGSIGISVYPEDGENAEMLIQSADLAMYHAKERGRNTFEFFKAEMNRKVFGRRRSLESNLRRALDREEFLLHYQPKVCLETGEITGVEALIRWQQMGGKLVLPGEFVPVAEQCGLIVQIGRWVLREACQQARAWQNAGLPPVQIAVNVSATEFRDKDFIRGVRKVLSEAGLEPRYLEFELTEGVLMQDVASTASVLQELKEMGVRLAVDDFGTGFSSLSYLRQFPIDVLKIDQSFVHQMSADPDDSVIVCAIIQIAKNLNHLVVAEGIETPEQKAKLQAMSCAEGQGYLFSRPLGATQFAQLLESGIHAGV